tara:strand:- start:14881 stop:15372 length:492 start_codon:yes stop_codon:yes gene_type:complete
MLMAVIGTPEVEEKEYTFSTPLLAGLSYRLVNHNSTLLRKKLSNCYSDLERSIAKSKCEDLYNTDDLVKRVLNKQSDLWVSVDKGENIRGCFVIGFGNLPRGKGINAEAIAGKFNFQIGVPVVEKYYKELGFKFFEMTGRKGWKKIMKPLGYEFKSITIRKRL